MKGSAAMRKWEARLGYAFGVLTIALPSRAMAALAGGTLPWDAPLNTLQTDLQGRLRTRLRPPRLSAPGSCGPSANTAPASARCRRWLSAARRRSVRPRS
jgi:hypothetical protein